MNNGTIQYWKLFINDVNPQTITDLINFIFPIVVERKEIAKINLYISSTGGDIDSAIRFYDFIKASGAKIDTVGFGQVDSSAVLLFLCGENRIAIRNCRFRLHSPSYNSQLQSQHISVIHETSKFIQEIDNRYFGILSKELTLPVLKIRDIYQAGTILSPKDAIKIKVATAESDNLSFPI